MFGASYLGFSRTVLVSERVPMDDARDRIPLRNPFIVWYKNYSLSTSQLKVHDLFFPCIIDTIQLPSAVARSDGRCWGLVLQIRTVDSMCDMLAHKNSALYTIDGNLWSMEAVEHWVMVLWYRCYYRNGKTLRKKLAHGFSKPNVQTSTRQHVFKSRKGFLRRNMFKWWINPGRNWRLLQYASPDSRSPTSWLRLWMGGQPLPFHLL